MTTRSLICLILATVLVITGYNKIKSNKQFEELKKAQSEISSALDATHGSVIALTEVFKSFNLVSQPRRENSGPERMKYHREWLLTSSDRPPLIKTKELLISSLESILKKHVPADTAKIKYKAQVKDEEDSVRISIDANWDR